MNITFEIGINDGVKTEFFPDYGDDLSLVYKKDSSEIYFRQELSGSLTFKGSEYDTIYGYDNDDEIQIDLTFENGDEWSGFFGKFDGEWDEDACTFTITPTVDDKYSCLKQKDEEKWNILNVSESYDIVVDFAQLEYLTGEETVTLQTTSGTRYGYTKTAATPAVYTFPDSASPHNKPYGGDITADVYDAANPVQISYPTAYAKNINARTMLPDLADPTGSDDRGFVVYKTEIKSDDGTTGGANTETDFTVETTWFREVVWTLDIDGAATLPSGSGWGTIGQSVGSTIVDGIKLHKWARIPDNILSINLKWATDNGTTLPVSWTFDTSLLTDHTETLSSVRPLTNVIQYILDQMSCGLTYKSTFFDNDPLPDNAPNDIETIITAASGDNYVTEETNELNYLMIGQKSDIISCVNNPGIGCSSSQAATRGMLSLKEMSKILHNMFQVYPYIDDDGYFRYEHERFFFKELGTIDLTTQKNRFNNETWATHTNKYKFNIPDLYGKERWKFMEQNFIDFIGETIDYDSILSNTRIKQEVKEYSVDMVTTDIQFIYDVESSSPTIDGSISTDGFVIFQCSYSGGTYTCDNETGALSGVSMPNNHLSVANLQDKYWRWNRIQETGTLNNIDVTFNSTSTPKGSYQRTKEQVPVIFNVDDFDEMKLIKTELGEGEVKSASYNLTNGIMTVTLIYLP